MLIEQDTTSSTRLQFTVLSLMSLIGGYADASTYLLANSFTGHITGNTVLAAISLAKGDLRGVAIHLLAITCFISATTLGVLLTRNAEKMMTAFLPILAVEALFVVAAPLAVGHSSHRRSALIVSLCLSLGLQNGAYRRALGKGVHTTYVTGDVTTLLVSLFKSGVKLGRLSGSERADVRTMALIWMAFAVGAVTAGVAVHYFHARALWLLELPFVVVAVMTQRLLGFNSPPT